MKNKLKRLVKHLSIIIFTFLLCFTAFGCSQHNATIAYSRYAVQLDTGADESFLFFTDPHLMEDDGVIHYDYVKSKLGYIKNIYKNLQLDFVVCGGDWYNGETKVDVAKNKLKFVTDYMYGNIDKYYPVVGNHDTNYQGEKRLTTEEIIQLQCYKQGNTYYDFNGKNTHFYVFDTGVDRDTDITDERSEQIKWFAENIKDDGGEIALFSHMYYCAGDDVCVFSKEIGKICQAFNSRQTYEYTEMTYDYSECQGKVRFMLAGHTHADFVTVMENTDDIPVIATVNMAKGDNVNLDLVNVNYAEGKIKLIRVGNGQNREVDLAA